MKLINKRPFFWGLGVNCALIFYFIMAPSLGTHTSGPTMRYLEWYEQLLMLIPGILLMTNGLFPDSLPGKLGGLIFDFYAWVRRQNKK